jgi:AcrR family transcriptional regulator
MVSATRPGRRIGGTGARLPVMPARRGNSGDPATRNALLDAAQELMLAEGYAAVTTRRIAAEVGVNSALVFYYFDTMDGLFIALFQRGAEQSYERLQQALLSPQPLWGFWDLIHDRSGSALNMEFMALANHRKAIRAEIAESSRRFRRAQLDTFTSVLERYGLDPQRWPAASVILVLSSISRFLLIEEAFGLDIGHAETEALVEDHIRALEGDRLNPPPEPPLPQQRRATPTR